MMACLPASVHSTSECGLTAPPRGKSEHCANDLFTSYSQVRTSK